VVLEPQLSPQKESQTPVIWVEGGLFGPDFLADLRAGKVPFQTAKDFHLPQGRSLQEEISATYQEAKALYALFRSCLEGALGTEAEGELTRERWVRQFLGLLGYRLHYRGWVEAGGKRYEILYGADESPESPPVHVVPWSQDLSRAGRRGRSPHGLLQDYLNASEHLWGLVTNGRQLRLLRKTPFVRRQAYLEVDLEALLEGDRPEEFALVYRLLHRSRLPREAATGEEAPIERYYRLALEQGERAKARLREAVEGFLMELGTGFLRGPRGKELAQDPKALYHDLLRLTYRILFLLVAESRGVLGGNDLYRRSFSPRRLLDLSTDKEAYTGDHDLWLSLKTLFHLLRDPRLLVGEEPAAKVLGLDVLNGHLFEPISLEEDPYSVENRYLLRAFYHLAFFHDGKEGLKRINYAALDVEELGAVYESLLDHAPVVREDLSFAFQAGMERKKTGSYYTPDALVDLVLREALDPVVEERLRRAGNDPKAQEEALLSFKIIDPASGSGHFLLGAARRLARRLAQVRTGEEEPSPEAYRQAVRDVVANCLYAVDLNPLAVELCRVALWMESHVPGKPLTFLDHRVKCGNSLVGVLNPEVLLEGIPDDAFGPKEGDDKKLAAFLKKENRRQRAGEQTLFAPPSKSFLEEERANLATILRNLAQLPEDRPQDVAAKANLYEKLRTQGTWGKLKLASDLWTAAFFQRLAGAGPFITTGLVWGALEGRVDPALEALAEELAGRHRFFHWWLEFPEVFSQGGFDVVLGNPPWTRHHEEGNTTLFLKSSGRFPLAGEGTNTYQFFTELAHHLCRPGGLVGLLVPTGLATDLGSMALFRNLVEKGRLRIFYDFENRKGFFPEVDSRFRFALVVFEGRNNSSHRGEGKGVKMAFFLKGPEEVEDKRRSLTLSRTDIALFNPNTLTLPLFRTPQDAELTRHLYQKADVLYLEAPKKDPWKIRLGLLMPLERRSSFLCMSQDLQGAERFGHRLVFKGKRYVPFWEAKMFHQYNHRYADYASGAIQALPACTLSDPTYLVAPAYYLPEDVLEKRLSHLESPDLPRRQWLIAFRNVARATDERTVIFSILPRLGVGGKAPLLFSSEPSSRILALLANLNSLVLDYAARQKVGSTDITFHYLKQFPVLPPERYTPEDLRFIVPRVLELVYTAWDLAPLAQDVWEEADEGLREAIREWLKGARIHPQSPPGWLETPYPFPPFVWDEERRARLRAELDAYYARLYGLNRKQLRYILDPQDLTEGELANILSDHEEVEDPLDEKAYRKRREASRFPGETFRVLREKEIKRYGEYRTRRLVLEAWNELSHGE
jgi:hypothetical protein